MLKKLYTLEARMFAGLASPKRLEILHLLERRSLSVKQIVEMTGIPQANVSQHLCVLKRFCLVMSERRAQERVYSLSNQHVPAACEAVRHILLEKTGVKAEAQLSTLHLHLDPVCGMELTTHDAAVSLLKDGKRYYFCGRGCVKKFEHKFRAMNKGEETYVYRD